MKVTLAKFCDHACMVDGGKGSIIGMFNTLGAAQFPVIHPNFFIVVELEFERDEAGKQKVVKLTLIDEDGREIFGMEGQMIVPQPMGMRAPSMFHSFRIDHLTFPHPGTYRLDILDDGEPVSEVKLYVEQGTAPPHFNA